jgi:hypothetical protein
MNLGKENNSFYRIYDLILGYTVFRMEIAA